VATSAAAGSARQRESTSVFYLSSGLNATAKPRQRHCGGYVITDVTLRGASTTPNPRLQGTVRLTARFVMAANRNGFATGQFTLRDRRGRLKARAKLSAVIYRGTSVNGILTGRLMRPSAHLLANVTLFFSFNDFSGGILTLGLNQGQNSAIAYSLPRNCAARVGARP
jgi:hypothetical protein